jgi:hypothetical protein
MVKRTRHGTPWIGRHGTPWILRRLGGALPVALLLALLAGCTGRGFVDLHPETLSFAPEAAGGAVSLVRIGGELLGVFSDRSTASLDSVQVPIGEHLPTQAEVDVVDVVDFAPPLSAAFGRHVLTSRGDTAALLYEDRASADTTVLKLATRGAGASQWTVDVMDPAGEPLSVVPNPDGGFDAFWAQGSLFWWRPSGVTAEVMPGFKPSGAPHTFGPGGFTAYNADDNSLYVVERIGGIFRARSFPVAGPVQSSLESPDGTLSVLSWDGSTRRLLLFEDAHDGRAPVTTTVTISDDTHVVALLPGHSGGPQLFLFDETNPSGGLRAHRVSLVAPAAALGQPGNRYLKSVLFEGTQAVEGLDAVETPGALYVLVQSAGMTLVRVPVPGAPAPLS